MEIPHLVDDKCETKKKKRRGITVGNEIMLFGLLFTKNREMN